MQREARVQQQVLTNLSIVQMHQRRFSAALDSAESAVRLSEAADKSSAETSRARYHAGCVVMEVDAQHARGDTFGNTDTVVTSSEPANTAKRLSQLEDDDDVQQQLRAASQLVRCSCSMTLAVA